MSRQQLLIVFLLGLSTVAAPTRQVAHSLDPKGRLAIWDNKVSLPQGFGLAYGPYRQHESPDGLQPTEEEIREDLRLLKALLPEPRRIRVYSSIGPGGLAAIIASEEGFSVTLGAWIEEDLSRSENNEREIAELIRLVPIVHPEIVTVGNETLLRINTNPKTSEEEKSKARENLKSYIRRVKAALPNMKVSTAEPWATWVADPTGKDLVGLVDLLTVHVHPFWEGTSVEQAPQAVIRNLDLVREKFGKPVILGETGWPSDGIPEGSAIPNPENQRAFITEFVRLTAMQNTIVFLFSAFDEPHKGVAERGSNADAAVEGPTGAHWGIFSWNRILKPQLKGIFGEPGAPNPSSLLFRVLTRGMLAPGYDLGLDTQQQQRDWIKQISPAEAERPDNLSAFRLTFPDSQCWGSVFITTRKPVPNVQARYTTDLSAFDRVAIDLRLIAGDDGVEIAVKNPEWPDDGTESKVLVKGLSRQWQTVVIPLSFFTPTDLKRLYVVGAFDFSGMEGKTIDVAEVRFLPPSISISSSLLVTPLLLRQNLSTHVLSDGVLSCGYGLGVATADPFLADWIQSQFGYLRLSYPGGRDWGSAFFTVGNPPPLGGQRLSTDLTGLTYLAVEMRGQAGGEMVQIGIRSVTTNNQSLALTCFRLSTDWSWVYVPLGTLLDLKRIYVITSIEFQGANARTVDVRNIRLLTQEASLGFDFLGANILDGFPRVNSSIVPDNCVLIGLPAATTKAASTITSVGATLNGVLNPNGDITSAVFEWSLSNTFVSFNTSPAQPVGSAATGIAVSANLAGLAPNTKYYYRLAVTNSNSRTIGTVLSFTTNESGFEADVVPRPTGNNNGTVTVADWVQIGRFVSGLDMIADSNEFRRADCAPRETLGDGQINISDWVQAGRYVSGLDPAKPIGGPTALATLLPNKGRPDALATRTVESKTEMARQIKAMSVHNEPNSVVVKIDGLGDENAIGFGLNFDSSLLQFLEARVSDELRGATLIVNSKQASAGHIGIALALPAGRGLSPGTHTLITICFKPIVSRFLGETQVQFDDDPIQRAVVDINGIPLVVGYTGAVIEVNARTHTK